MSEKLSIIIPVFNAEGYIHRCLEGILRQTYADIEVILVDDGSRDSSLQICRQLQAQDRRIKVYSQQNSGPSAARNTGLRASSGDYITFVDCDDELTVPQAYEIAMQEFSAPEVDVVVFGSEALDETSGQAVPMLPTESGRYTPAEAVPQILYDNLAFGGGFPWNKIWRRSVLCDPEQAITLFDCTKYAYEDKLWVLKNMQRVRKMAVVNTVMYRYRVRENSLSHDKQREMCNIINGLQAYDEIARLYHGTDAGLQAYAYAKQIRMITEKLCAARKQRDMQRMQALKTVFLQKWKWAFRCRVCGLRLKMQVLYFRMYFALCPNCRLEE